MLNSPVELSLYLGSCTLISMQSVEKFKEVFANLSLENIDDLDAEAGHLHLERERHSITRTARVAGQYELGT